MRNRKRNTKRSRAYDSTSMSLNVGMLRDIAYVLSEVHAANGPDDETIVGFNRIYDVFCAVSQIRYSGELFRWREHFDSGGLHNPEILMFLIRYEDAPLLKPEHWILLDRRSVSDSSVGKLFRIGDVENLEERSRIWRCYCAHFPKDQKYLQKFGISWAES